MLRIATLLAAGAFAAVLSTGAQAMTPAPLTTQTDIIQVREGCGPGWHRGPRGGCRRNGVVVCRSVRTAHGWRRVCR